ncbi:hypothetical protein RCL1_002044 [Eukaryota sp. TZLM3-RCL]
MKISQLLLVLLLITLTLAESTWFFKTPDEDRLYKAKTPNYFVLNPTPTDSLSHGYFGIKNELLYYANLDAVELSVYKSSTPVPLSYDGAQFRLKRLCFPIAIVSPVSNPDKLYAAFISDSGISSISQEIPFSLSFSSCSAVPLPLLLPWTSVFSRPAPQLNYSLAIGSETSFSIYFIDFFVSNSEVVFYKTISSSSPHFVSIFFRGSSMYAISLSSSSFRSHLVSSSSPQSHNLLSSSEVGNLGAFLGGSCVLTNSLSDINSCYFGYSKDSNTLIHHLNTTFNSNSIVPTHSFTGEPISTLALHSSLFFLYNPLPYRKVFPASVSSPGETIWFTNSLVPATDVSISMCRIPEIDEHDCIVFSSSQVNWNVETNSLVIPSIEESVKYEFFLGGNYFTTFFTFNDITLEGPRIIISPKIDSISTELHSTFGGSTINIHGSGFRPTAALHDLYLVAFMQGFGNCAFTKYLSYSNIQCVVPEGHGGPWKVAVRLGNSVTNTSDEFVMTYRSPLITSFTPDTSATPGGSYIEIIGHDFGPSFAPRTAFIGLYPCIVTRYVSHNRLQCLVPPGVGRGHEVYVMVSNLRSSHHLFPFPHFNYEPPSIVLVSRNVLSFNGGTLVSIQGTNFGNNASLISANIGGKFSCNDVTIPHFHYSINCIADPGSGANLNFTVTVDSQTVTFDSNLRYDRPVIYNISPEISTYFPSTTVLIQGRFLGHAFSEVQVYFGDTFSSINLISSDLIEATVPYVAGQNLVIQVVTDDQRSNRNVTFSTPLPTIFYVSDYILETENFSFHVFGYNLLIPLHRITAFIGDIKVIPSEVVFAQSFDRLTFSVESGVGQNLPLNILFDGVEAEFIENLSENIPLISFEPPVIDDVFPLSGSPDFVEIMIDGQNLGSKFSLINDPNSFISVKIGSLGNCQTVYFVNETLVCEYVNGGGRDLTVSLTVAGQTTSFDQLFSFDPPLITSISPNSEISTTATQQVSIFGQNFGNINAIISISFSHSFLPPITCSSVRRWSISEVSCFFTPRIGTGWVPSITVQGQENFEIGQEIFFSFKNPQLVRVEPDILSTVGGRIVLFGRDFGTLANQITVTFGQDQQIPCNSIEILPTVDSLSSIACTVNPGVGSALPIHITVAQQSNTISNLVTLSFIQPVISSISPSEIPTQGSLITISGTNLGSFSSLVSIYFISFSNNRQFRHFCSSPFFSPTSLHSSFTCTLPPGLGRDLIPVVEIGGQAAIIESSVVINYALPFISSVSPLFYDAKGCQDGIIFGSNFGPSDASLVEIFIGNVEVVDFEIVSDGQINFKTPGLIGIFPINILIFDHVITSDQVLTFQDFSVSSVIYNSLSFSPFTSLFSVSGGNFPYCDCRNNYEFVAGSTLVVELVSDDNDLIIPCFDCIITSSNMIDCYVSINNDFNSKFLNQNFRAKVTILDVSHHSLPFSFASPSVSSTSLFNKYFYTSSAINNYPLFYLYGNNFIPSKNVVIKYDGSSICDEILSISSEMIVCKPNSQASIPTNIFRFSLHFNDFVVSPDFDVIQFNNQDALLFEIHSRPINSELSLEFRYSAPFISGLLDKVEQTFCHFFSTASTDVFSVRRNPTSCPVNILPSGIFTLKISNNEDPNVVTESPKNYLEYSETIGIYSISDIEPNFITTSGGLIYINGDGFVYSPIAFAEITTSSNQILVGNLPVKIISHTLAVVDVFSFEFTGNFVIVKVYFNGISSDFVSFSLPILSFSVLPPTVSSSSWSFIDLIPSLSLNSLSSILFYSSPLLSLEGQCLDGRIYSFNQIIGPDFENLIVPSSNYFDTLCRGISDVLNIDLNILEVSELTGTYKTSPQAVSPSISLPYLTGTHFYPPRSPSTGGIELTILATGLVYPPGCTGETLVGDNGVNCPVVFFGPTLSIPAMPREVNGSQALVVVVPPLLSLYPDEDIPVFFKLAYLISLRLSYTNDYDNSFEFSQFFEYFAHFEVSSVFPLSSDVSGGVEIIFSGTSLGLLANSIRSIHLSSVLVITPVRVLSDDSFSIISPPSFDSHSGNIVIELDETVELDFIFNYFDFIVSDYYPQTGRIDTPGFISVVGNYFPDVPLGHIFCKFGPNPVSTTTFLNSSLIRCPLPRTTIVEQFVNLSISFDAGFHYSEVGEFYIEPSGAKECRNIHRKISKNDFSDPTSIGSFDFIQKRSFRVPYNLPNIAVSSPVISTTIIDESTASLQFSTLTDGDRCCLKTENSRGICGVQFTYPGDTDIIVSLSRPAVVNNIVTSWNNPCSCQPVTFSIYSKQTAPGVGSGDDFIPAQSDPLLDWTYQRTHYTGRGALPAGMAFTNPRVCPHIQGDSNDVAVCLDPFRDPIVATEFRITWDNRLASRDRSWLLEIELEGLYLDMPFSISIQPTQVTVETDILVSVPGSSSAFIINTFNYFGENLADLTPSVDLICVSLVNSQNVNVTHLISSPHCLSTINGKLDFPVTLSAPPRGSYTLIFTSDSIFYNTTASVTVTDGPPRYIVPPTNLVLEIILGKYKYSVFLYLLYFCIFVFVFVPHFVFEYSIFVFLYFLS